jgi:hypothetical protein
MKLLTDVTLDPPLEPSMRESGMHPTATSPLIGVARFDLIALECRLD